MKTNLVILAVVTLLASGCETKTSHKFLSPKTSAMDPCTGNITSPIATFDVILPEKVDLGNLINSRNVYLNRVRNLDTKPGRLEKEPFHLYLKNRLTSRSGFILVQIEIPGTSKYRFYFEEDGNGNPKTGAVQGVGLGGEDAVGKLCGATVMNSHKTAKFYIDAAKFRDDSDTASFNIGLFPPDVTDTPIFIDPKVRNDG